MTLPTKEKEYPIGQHVKVRKLEGIYEIHDSWLVGGGKNKRRRYKLNPVRESGALLTSTESYADGMTPVPAPKPLELAPDPAPATGPATVAQEQAGPVAAPPVADAAADAIRSPAGTFTHDAGTFGGELDEYSPGAQAGGPGELQSPYKPIRRFPQRPTYQDLKCIVYNARFKGLEDLNSNKLASLGPHTPIAVVVTHETNGHAIWIVTTEDGDEVRRAYLEQFYPKMPGSDADAIEYAVLLALRQVPIRSEDLEILLLQLG